MQEPTTAAMSETQDLRAAAWKAPGGAAPGDGRDVGRRRSLRARLQGRLRVLPSVGGRVPIRLIGQSARMACRDGRLADDGLDGRLTETIGLQYWTYTSTGRAALTVLLRALAQGRPGRDEVVIPAYTSYSVPAAVVRAGLGVVCCDIESKTLGLDPDALERAIGDRTLCVVANHLYGLPCRMEAICTTARRYGVPVIEDAAQGLGIYCEGKRAGQWGEAAIFSVSRGKVLPGAGGGLVGTNDVALARQCRAGLASGTPRFGVLDLCQTTAMACFIHPMLYWIPSALPFLQLGQSRFEPDYEINPMTRFQRALLCGLLDREADLRRSRQAQGERLRRELEGADVEILWPRQGDDGAFLRLIVLARDSGHRHRLLQSLTECGLGATGGYPLALSQLPALALYARRSRPCPAAEDIAQRLVTLPTHPWVTAWDCRHIAQVVHQWQ